MGRVLPSGRVFGEAVDLPNVQFAQREKFGGRLEEVIESPVTDLAVAGISRIKDELDYIDRLNAEKQRQEAAQSAVTQAQQQLQQLREQQAMGPGTGLRGEQLPPGHPGYTWTGGAEANLPEPADDIRNVNDATLAWYMDLAIKDGDKGLAELVDSEMLRRRRSPRQPTVEEGPVSTPADLEIQKAMEGDLNKLKDLAQEARALGDEDAVMRLEDAIEKREWPGLQPKVTGFIFEGEPGPAPERRDYAKEIAEAEAKLAAAKAGVGPARFVPRTLADFRMVAKDLEQRILAAESMEEREALGQRLLQTMQTARGAVDMPSEDVFEAVHGAAGKRAQKTIFEDLSVVDKEFIKQMREEAKEKRAISREERAEAAAKRAERGEERAIAAADRAAGASERAKEKHDVFKKKNARWMRGLSVVSKNLRRKKRDEQAHSVDRVLGYANNYMKWKQGQITDDQWMGIAGYLADERPEVVAERAIHESGLRGDDQKAVRTLASNLMKSVKSEESFFEKGLRRASELAAAVRRQAEADEKAKKEEEKEQQQRQATADRGLATSMRRQAEATLNGVGYDKLSALNRDILSGKKKGKSSNIPPEVMAKLKAAQEDVRALLDIADIAERKASGLPLTVPELRRLRDARGD